VKRSSSSSIHLKGRPNRLATVLRLPAAAFAGETSCSVKLPGVEADRVRVRPIKNTNSGASILKIKLPHDTPPGAYTGTVQIGETEMPITIDVEVHRDLRLFPSILRAEVTPGASVAASISVLNAGNSAVTIASEHRFCVFDSTGIDRAFFVALASDDAKGPQRLDRFLEELADAHGGRVQVRIKSGAGTIPAGEMVDVGVEFRFSDRLRVGREYAGSWKLENAAYRVEIRVSGPRQEQSE
jgi:hypothetical protein